MEKPLVTDHVPLGAEIFGTILANVQTFLLASGQHDRRIPDITHQLHLLQIGQVNDQRRN